VNGDLFIKKEKPLLTYVFIGMHVLWPSYV